MAGSGPTKGGSGGKLGHSNMSHGARTEAIKQDSKKRRRRDDRATTKEGVKNITNTPSDS